MMGRRGFLKFIGVGVLGLTLALKRPDAPIDFAPPRDDNGMSVRFIRNWDAVKTQDITRFDVLYGYANVRPEFAVRLTHVPTLWERIAFWRAA